MSSAPHLPVWAGAARSPRRDLPLGRAPGHEDQHGDEGAGGAVDPHIWFDVEVMADVARATDEAFAAADPGNAAAQRANAAEAGDELLEVSPLDAVTDEQVATGFVELVRHQATQAAQFARAFGCRARR